MEKKEEFIASSDYTYVLPDHRIAKFPLEQRDQSKLLIYRKVSINQDVFCNLPSYLPADSTLFFNNTRVIHARLRFKRETGAQIEIFCLSPHDPGDYQQAFSAKNRSTWLCMVGNLKKWKEDQLSLPITIGNEKFSISAKKLSTRDSGVVIEFSWNADYCFGEIIEEVGMIPIPPYLNRESENSDKDRYQTVYSSQKGSVAAPTAGLHFTQSVLTDISAKNISLQEITLHVGAGTFQPIKNVNVLEHKMHAEFFTVTPEQIEALSDISRKIIATGTTTLRTLESLYWLALKSVNQKKVVTHLDQWEYKNMVSTESRESVFRQFLELLRRDNITTYAAYTGIMIVPGYDFKVVKGLITNFHQPNSTLLLLIAAFVGDDWKRIYQYALDNDFRFLSYGDSSLLLRE